MIKKGLRREKSRKSKKTRLLVPDLGEYIKILKVYNFYKIVYKRMRSSKFKKKGKVFYLKVQECEKEKIIVII